MSVYSFWFPFQSFKNSLTVVTNRLIMLHLQLSVDHIDDLLDAVPAIAEAEILCFHTEAPRMTKNWDVFQPTNKMVQRDAVGH